MWTRPYRVLLASEDNPLLLDCGEKLFPIEVEYEAYGKLNEDRDNVILLLHALSGDAHGAGWDETAQEMGRSWRLDRPGWWDAMIGPARWIRKVLYNLFQCTRDATELQGRPLLTLLPKTLWIGLSHSHRR